MNWPQIEEITYSECDNPHKLLGPHKQGSKMLVQAYFPGAEKVTIHWKKTGQVGEAFLTDVPMELADEEGYFAALVNAGKMSPYEYVVESIQGEYAYLRRTDIYDSGEPMMIAMALLPEGVDVGTRLRWENLVYTIL